MIDVVIVNWNSADLLREALESLEKFNNGLISTVSVIDNNSSDQSLRCTAGKTYNDFSFQVIKNKKNIGFGAACNMGAKVGESDFILFMNPDAQLFEGTLKGAAAFINLESSRHVGILGVKLIDTRGNVARHCSRFPSATNFIFESVGLGLAIPGVGLFMSEWDHMTSRAVDHVLGAFFFVRREVFGQLNGFDEDYFVYFEDLDFSRRASLAGWQSFYLEDVAAHHEGGGTTKQIKYHRHYLSIISRYIYVKKHLPFPSRLMIFFFAMTFENLIRTAQATLRDGIAGLVAMQGVYARFFLCIVARGKLKLPEL